MSVFTYFNQHQSQIWGLLGTHAWLSALPVVLGLVIALPIGWVAARFRWTYPPLITLTGLLYTIPSLALFVFLPGILKLQILDPINVAVALTIYTVALLVRVVADGLSAVPLETRQAAVAMGYTARQRFFAVDLPLSVPVIAAGLRVAVVSNVSLVAVATTVGVSQLGQLFTDGLQLQYFPPIIVGIVLCLALALVYDGVVVTGTRLMTPWQRRAAAR